jgi:hypothetical protein
MRNTSPVGWIPLLFHKSYYQSIVPFVISGIFVALPLIFVCVYMDSIYYMHANTSSSGTSLNHHSEIKKFEWTITSLNFLKVNVLEGLSKYFGDHRFTEYIFKFLPEDIFRGMIIFMVFGVYVHYKEFKS